jgi:hypothetical protein
MAATVKIGRWNGANPGASNDITSASLTLGTSDEATQGSPIPIPSSGSNYSYWAHTALVATVAPDTAIDNIFWYTDGTNSLGTGVNAIVSTASAYDQATGTAGSSGELLNVTNHASLSGCPRDGSTSPMFLYDSGCKLTISGSIDASTGSAGDFFVVYQINVVDTAGAGNTAEETMTFEYDES